MKAQNPLHVDCPSTDNGQRVLLSMGRGFNFMEKPKLVEDLGQQYPTLKSKRTIHYALFECPYCKTIFRCFVGSIKNGDTTSCGCYRKSCNKSHPKHGKSYSRIYRVYRNILERCTRKSNKDYPYYGGRGITICMEWRVSPSCFFDWALKNGYRDGLEIDRINNDGNYEPSNCRWVNRNINHENTRLIKSTNKSGYRCVYFGKRQNKWISQIRHLNIVYHLGSFETKELAAIAYNNWVIEHKTNHPLNIINN